MIYDARGLHALKAYLTVAACAIALVACGGGGGGASSAPGAPTAPIDPAVPVSLSPPVPANDAPTLVTLVTEPGTPTDTSKSYRYGAVNAVVTVTGQANRLLLEVEGEEQWSAIFQLPNSLSALQVGHYESKTGAPFHEPAVGGITWSGEGSGCFVRAGAIDIDKVSYSNNELRSIEMRFAMTCEGQSYGSLRGTIRWVTDDPTPPTQPLAIPNTLWRAPNSSVPSSGAYVYVTGEAQNPIVEGDTFLYTSNAAELNFSPIDRGVEITVGAAERWNMRFVPMAPQTKLLPGYYAFISGKRNPAFGFMQVGGGRKNIGCGRDVGWFAVDRADYSGTQLIALDLRFEMNCFGLMHGQVHWRSGDTLQPNGPVNPVPAGLWTPPTNELPLSGNVLYMESDPSDQVGRGQKVFHTNADALFTPGRSASGLSFSINGTQYWNAMFQPMSGLQRIEPGYYGSLGSNPSLGTVKVGNLLYNCPLSRSAGWFAVDSINYSGVGELTSIDMRFEQRCSETGGPALRGRLRWTNADPTLPAPPVNPPPSNLWSPPAGVVPASGNYVYLESGGLEYSGPGRTYVYTPNNAVFSIQPDRDFYLSVQGDDHWWGDFRYIYSDRKWRPGYYANTQRSGFHNPARGGLTWLGGLGCNKSDGWIVVDSVQYDANGLHDIELRFENYCDEKSTPAHGKLRWNRDDHSLPPGPISPPPSSLWSAPAAKLPSSGSYLYMESDASDFVGSGRSNQASTYVYPLAENNVLNFSKPAAIDFRLDADSWMIAAAPMIPLTQFLPGYYPDALGAPTTVPVNPAKGGISVSGFSRSCGGSHGWYVIDTIRFENGKMIQLDMRFEQRCDRGDGGSLRGQIHWAP